MNWLPRWHRQVRDAVTGDLLIGAGEGTLKSAQSSDASGGRALQKVLHAIPANCRSRLAGDGLKCAAFSQDARVIVDDHRWQASSYTRPSDL
jgi:hypothetical protein